MVKEIILTDGKILCPGELFYLARRVNVPSFGVVKDGDTGEITNLCC
jgi:hypothetical protein